MISCADRESFVRGGLTLTGFLCLFLLVDEGREDSNTTISGSSWARQRTPFKWRFAGVPMMAKQLRLAWQLKFVICQGIWTSVAKNPIFVGIFRGGPDPAPSGSANCY